MNLVGPTHCFVIRRLCPGLLVDLPADWLRKNCHTVIRGKVCMCSDNFINMERLPDARFTVWPQYDAKFSNTPLPNC